MTDHTFTILVELESPMLIGTDREFPLFMETRDYIPGGVLRGSLARAMNEAGVLRGSQAPAQHQSAAGDGFERLFGGTGPPIFENLYPTLSQEGSYPVPLSARSCKRQPGFETESGANHGVGDVLIRQAVFEHFLVEGPALPLLYQPVCPKCGSELDRPGDVYYETAAGVYRPVRTPIRRQSHTAINRKRYTAADNMLYTQETIQPGLGVGQDRTNLFFRGVVRCQAGHAQLLRNWLPRVKWIGQGRSRGQGQVRLTITDEHAGPANQLPSLGQRLAAFNKAVRLEWEFYKDTVGVTMPDANEHFFCLDLAAPAFFNRCGLPALQPDLTDLNLETSEAGLMRAFADRIVVSGWHMGAGLPRRTQLAAVMGSVYMYRTSGLSLDELEERLSRVEQTGLGEERERGFGSVLVSSPFHYQAEVIL